MTTNAEIKRHVDWSIIGLVGTIAGLLVQSATIVWWASGLNEKVNNIESRMASMETSSATLARLDERTAAMQTDLSRTYARVEQLERER
jgi:hypothetical protein